MIQVTTRKPIKDTSAKSPSRGLEGRSGSHPRETLWSRSRDVYSFDGDSIPKLDLKDRGCLEQTRNPAQEYLRTPECYRFDEASPPDPLHLVALFAAIGRQVEVADCPVDAIGTDEFLPDVLLAANLSTDETGPLDLPALLKPVGEDQPRLIVERVQQHF